MGTVEGNAANIFAHSPYHCVLCPPKQGENSFLVKICGGNYLFSEDVKSWDDAYGQCELYDAHLWQIDNLAENFCLLDYSHTMGYNAPYWHSANDKASEGVWQQADGTLLSWSPRWVAAKDLQGDPNGGKAENCAGVHLDEGTEAGQWWDASCT